MRKSMILGSALAHLLMTAVADEAGSSSGATATETNTDGTKIRPNMENYQTAKSAGGSSTKICGDEVSLALLGATLDEAYGFVATVTNTAEAVLREKYGTKNPGQQRMFLGNLIRGASQSKDAEKKARVEAAFKEALPAFRTSIDARLAVAAEARQEELDLKAAAKQKIKDDKAAQKKLDQDKRAADALAKKKQADDAKAKPQASGTATPAAAKPAQAKGPGSPSQPQ